MKSSPLLLIFFYGTGILLLLLHLLWVHNRWRIPENTDISTAQWRLIDHDKAESIVILCLFRPLQLPVDPISETVSNIYIVSQHSLYTLHTRSTILLRNRSFCLRLGRVVLRFLWSDGTENPHRPFQLVRRSRWNSSRKKPIIRGNATSILIL